MKPALMLICFLNLAAVVGIIFILALWRWW